jgi:hypothetical protein
MSYTRFHNFNIPRIKTKIREAIAERVYCKLLEKLRKNYIENKKKTEEQREKERIDYLCK